MQNSDRLLHIHSGIHAGAQCAAVDGMTLGSSLDCDAVLSDAGVPARGGTLRIGSAQWQIDVDGPAIDLEFGHITAFYGVQISVAHAKPVVLPNAAAQTDVPRRADGARSWTRLALTAVSRRCAFAVTVCLLGAASWASIRADAPKPVTPHPDLHPAAPRSSLPTAAASIHHTERPALPHPPTGAPANRAASRAPAPEQVTAILSNFTGRWQVSDESEKGSGLRIQGVFLDARDWQAAQAALHLELPGAHFDSTQVYSAVQAEAALNHALAVAGLTEATLVWEATTLQVRVPYLPDALSLRLEQALASFNSRYAGIAQRTDASGRTRTTVSMPFAIRGVSHGATPYLLLPDGSPLLPGGRHGQYRLLDIRGDKIVFDRPIVLEVRLHDASTS